MFLIYKNNKYKTYINTENSRLYFLFFKENNCEKVFTTATQIYLYFNIKNIKMSKKIEEFLDPYLILEKLCE
jgi:hypothetical protein